MKIYVACLAAYNSGILHGKWIDCSGKSAEDLQEEVNQILKSSPIEGAEDFAIHDTEGDLDWVQEYTSLNEIAEFVDAVENDGVDADLLCALIKEGNTVIQAFRNIKNFHVGSYEYFREFSDNAADELLCQSDETLKRYFDYEAFARDLEMDYYVIYTKHSVHVLSY